MLPSQQQSRATGKRPPSVQGSRSRFVELTDTESHGSNARHSAAPAGVPAARPRTSSGDTPLLPPIPRVASQYGSHGPVNVSQLEMTILGMRVDEEPAETSQYRPLSGRPATAGGRLPPAVGMRPAETPVTPGSFSRNVNSPPEAPRPRTASSNFSRPLQSSRISTAEPPGRSWQERGSGGDSGVWSGPPATPSSRAAPSPPSSSFQRTEAAPPASPRAVKQTSMPPPPRSMPDTTQPLRSTMPPPVRQPPLPPPTTQPPKPALFSHNSTPAAPANPQPSETSRFFSRPFSSLRPGTSDGTVSQSRPRQRPAPLHPQSSDYPVPDSMERPHSAKWSSSDSAASTLVPPSINRGKQKQPMLNRFNPMSLLSRRKSAHPPPQPPPELFSPPLPADFDPRIRGHLVHDFSAPRPKQTPRGVNGSPFRRGADFREPSVPPAQPQAPPSPSRMPREPPRTPVFTEHFDDDGEGWRLDDGDRRNQDTTGIAARVPTDLSEQTLSSLPVFAKRLSRDALTLMPPAPPPQRPLPRTPKPPSDEAAPPGVPPADRASIETDRLTARTPERGTSPRSDRLSPGSPSQALDGVPKRLKSDASRFSFDLAGVGSAAQEKLLEDKHRERAAQKARESSASGVSIVETDDEENGYDEFDMDGGFEEDIPGMEDEFPVGNVSDFSLPSMSGPALSAHPLSGLNNSWNLSMPAEHFVNTDVQNDEEGDVYTPTDNDFDVQATPPPQTTAPPSDRLRQMQLAVSSGNFVDDDDDDLYFDDGMMDSADLEAGEAFDETLLDDEESKIYGIPLRDQPKTEPPQTIQTDSSQQSTRPMSLESAAVAANQARATTDTSRTSVQPSELVAPIRKSSLVDRSQTTGAEPSANLTKDNLAAYHDALAFAANKAAVEGRFERKQSVDAESAIGQSRVNFDLPNNANGSHPLDDDDDDGAFGFDDMDDLDDDAIIAEANAEALENDDEGYYGREFGFYAQANGGEVERVNGGYFGMGFDEMVKRSYSGRAGGQDPSLTPITERSEWSQRNSMISLAMAGGGAYGAGAVVSPGLAQLAAADSAHDEDNMSLSALMRLRRGAFGDSTTSLHSSAGSHKSGSPSNVLLSPGPPPAGPAGGVAPQALRSGSPNNFALRPPEGLFPEQQQPQQLTSPLLHMHMQNMQAQPMMMAQMENMAVWRQPPLSPPPPVGKSHSRNNSGAESITYVKEQDGDGGSRWVMEKRRTSEAGEVEVLGRQILESGRI